MSVESITEQLMTIGGHVVHRTMEAPPIDGVPPRDGGAQYYREYDTIETAGENLHLFYVYPEGITSGPYSEGLCVSQEDIDAGFTLSEEMLSEGKKRLDAQKAKADRKP